LKILQFQFRAAVCFCVNIPHYTVMFKTTTANASTVPLGSFVSGVRNR